MAAGRTDVQEAISFAAHVCSIRTRWQVGCGLNRYRGTALSCCLREYSCGEERLLLRARPLRLKVYSVILGISNDPLPPLKGLQIQKAYTTFAMLLSFGTTTRGMALHPYIHDPIDQLPRDAYSVPMCSFHASVFLSLLSLCPMSDAKRVYPIPQPPFHGWPIIYRPSFSPR